MEPTEPMDWVTINYAGVEIQATNFLDGVLIKMFRPGGFDGTFCPGWYVQERRGDMNGPALWPREERRKVFGIEIVEAK